MNTIPEAVLGIAPTIRGLTHDGRVGRVVTYRGGNQARDPAGIAVVTDSDDREELVRKLAAAVESVGCDRGVIRIPDTGDFELGPAPTGEADRDQVVAGKVAIVTGGGQGLGEGLVRHLHEAGAYVCIADVNYDAAAALADTLNANSNGRAYAVRVDVTSEESVRTAVKEVVARLGGVDLLVSNAGSLTAGGIEELSAEVFERHIDVNYTGYFLLVKHTAPVMIAQNVSGRYVTDIVQINSKSGLVGSNRNAAYAGSKFGGIGLTQSFALELAPHGIKVNAICPGNLLDSPLWSDPEKGLFAQYLRAGKVAGAKNTEDVRRHYEARVPMGRGCTVKDVVRALFYVVEQQYETGQAVPVTGGQIMLG
jgi:sorbitol-6-phosphate 2-dehydrogenase